MAIADQIGAILVIISGQIVAVEVLEIPVVVLVKEDSDCHDFTEAQATIPSRVSVSLFLFLLIRADSG